MSEAVNAADLPAAERAEMGLLGGSSSAPEPPQQVAINAAGRPYDPSTGRLIPQESASPSSTETTVTTQQRHSRELYDAASFFGLSEQEADSIETPMLRKMLRSMTAEHERARDAQERARFWEEQRRQGQPVSNQPQPPPEPQFDLGDELDAAANPKTHGLLKSIYEENRALKKKLEQIEQRDGARTQQAYFDAYDDAFASIGDPRFGEGSREEISQDSTEMNFRKRIILAAGADWNKHTPAQAKRLIQKAYRELYPEGPPKQAAKKPAEIAAAAYGGEPTPEPAQPARKANGKQPYTPEQWDRAGVPAPTRRAPEQLPEGRERAIAEVSKKLGQGTPQYEADQEIKAGLFRRGGQTAG